MGTDTYHSYAERQISGEGIEVFEPFGPMYRGSETRVYYQKPAGYDVDVRIDRGWIVLCLGPCRSTTAIGSDRRCIAEAYGPSITYMPQDCDIHVWEDPSRTSDIVLLAPPHQALEEAKEHHGIEHRDMNYFWSTARTVGQLARSFRRMVLAGELREVDPLEIETAVEQTVDHLLRLYVREAGGNHQPREFGLTRRQIQRATAFVDANLDKTVTLEAMAAETGLSRHHFARQFRVATGSSAYDYVLSRRMKLAMALLADSNASLTEIAVTSGFFDAAHMSNQFVKRVGARPSGYRRIMRS